MTTKQVTICTDGECGGDCYACRLKASQKEINKLVKKIDKLVGLLQSFSATQCKYEDSVQLLKGYDRLQDEKEIN